MKRALLVDDSRATRRILKLMLGNFGFETSEAENGIEGLAVLEQSEPFELAVVDWNMPQMDGLEFLKQVRAKSIYDKMLVLMVTAETEASQVVQALEFGANEYVMKPFTPDVIADKLGLLGFELT